jgi:RNA polymerase sigma factor (sigma-70 family)
MCEDILNFDFENSSDEQRKHWLHLACPILQKIFMIAQKICAVKPMSCDQCPEKQKCARQNEGKLDLTCLVFAGDIPRRDEGKGYREKKVGLLINDFSDEPCDDLAHDETKKQLKFDREMFKNIKKIMSDEEFERYQNIILKLEETQWEVVCLRLRQGKKWKEIAETLKISVSAASERFRRAKKQLKKYHKKNNGEHANACNTT